MQVTNLDEANHLPTETICFYGPASSGKTTMFRAFLHAMNRPDLRRKLDTAGMQIKISYLPRNEDGGNWIQVGRAEPFAVLLPTRSLTAKLYRVEREPENGLLLNPRFNISTSYHYIKMIDDRGGIFDIAQENIQIGRILNGRIPEDYQDIDRIQQAWQQLVAAKVILVLLDATEASKKSKRSSVNALAEQQAVFKMPHHRQLEIAKRIDRIAEMKGFIDSQPDNIHQYQANKIIAICCMKVDDERLYPDRQTFMNTVDGSVDSFIERRFGEEVVAAIEALRQTYGTNNTETFLISATGWDNDGNSNAPKSTSTPMRQTAQPTESIEDNGLDITQDSINVNNQGQKIVEIPEEWNPYGVVETFKWVFGKLDQARVTEGEARLRGLWGRLGDVHRRQSFHLPYGEGRRE